MSAADFPEQRPTRAEVSLDALEANLAAIRSRAGGLPVMGVVKADAYGHGAVPVARALAAAGIDRLAVALLEEAQELRRAGIEVPILVMGPLEPAQMEAVVRERVTPALFREDQIAALQAAASRAGRPAPFHLKVDTGMGRLGVPWTLAGALLEILARSPALALEGVFSHLACADDPDHPLTRVQRERFDEVVGLIRSRGYAPPLLHLANSAAVLDRLPEGLTLVRPGLLLYGYRPSPRNRAIPLAPVLRLTSRIVLVKEVPEGEAVGYGATFVARRKSRIATVAAGYDDGVIRSLSNRGHFLVRGRRVPIAGRISMDLTTLDVTDIPEAALGDEAVLIGSQGGELQGADQVAAEAGTVSWEILCGIGWRVPRLYFRGGRLEEVRSRFARGRP
ncbi:MAG TPA: alanine racemase [Candidatus Polarisedimenticolia bacterium]|nr:alanine racemase [Candidatus Polarisedimenticolia bacterium]